MNDLITVVIPSYNHAKYLPSAIGSVLSQDYGDLELIVIDDGSTDESVEIARSITDPRIKVFEQENRGAHAALNRGIELAQGKYITILNSDDEFLPDRLSRLVQTIESAPSASLVCSYIQLIDHDGNPLGIKEGFLNLDPKPCLRPHLTFKPTGDAALNLAASNYIATTSNILLLTDTARSIGGFRPYRFTHDWDFALRAAAIGKIEIVAQPLVRYRIHPTNTIRQDRRRMIADICITLAANLGRLLDKNSNGYSADELLLRLTRSLDVYDCDRLLASLVALFGFAEDEDALIRDATDSRTKLGAAVMALVAEQTVDEERTGEPVASDTYNSTHSKGNRSASAPVEVTETPKTVSAKSLQLERTRSDKRFGMSVIVPTYNRASVLLETLGAFDAQDLADVPFEVIVVDDGSTDGTANILKNYLPRSFSMRALRQDNAGPAAARNAGIDAATGRLILFTGDDMVPSGSMLRLHWEAHRELDDPRAAVLGRVVWHPSIAASTVMTHVCGPNAEQFGFYHFRDGDRVSFAHFYTSNISLSSDLFAEGQRFSTSFSKAAFEDVELGYRLEQQGLKIVYRHQPLCFHRHFHSARSFARRQIAAGEMAAVLLGLQKGAGSCTRIEVLRQILKAQNVEQYNPLEGLTLKQCESMLLGVLTPFDFHFVPGLDTLHRAAFQYFYFKGFAESYVGEGNYRPDVLFHQLAGRELSRFQNNNAALIPEPDSGRLHQYLSNQGFAN